MLLNGVHATAVMGPRVRAAQPAALSTPRVAVAHATRMDTRRVGLAQQLRSSSHALLSARTRYVEPTRPYVCVCLLRANLRPLHADGIHSVYSNGVTCNDGEGRLKRTYRLLQKRTPCITRNRT